MKFYSIKSTQHLPISLTQAWDFFSSPNNLHKITPPDMDFKTTSGNGSEPMQAGQIITYTLRPVAGIPVKWMTEITHVKHHEYFVDEQRFGPYKLWHHKHIFKQTPTGVEMQDIVNYVLPFGFIGTLAHKLFVRKRIEAIFDYRAKVLAEIFGK